MIIETTLLKPAAVKIAGSLSAAYLGKKVSSHQNNKAQQAQIQLCIEELCEQWLLSVMKSLAAMDYEDQALRDFFQHYNHDLERYVKDEQVVEELLKPLSETSSHYQLNSELLQKHWQELSLQALPEDFDIQEICNLYVKRIQKQSIVSPDLRCLYLAQLNQDSTNYLQALRGAWPDFDLDQYKTRLTERYKVLDLSALTPPTRDDNDTRLMLQDVFMPQTVKESRPPSELPKERWQQLQNQGEVKDAPEDFRADEFARLQESWMQQSSKPVLDIFTRHKLVVLGDPGSGKSSLVRYLLLSCLNPPKNDAWLEPLKGHLPLLIELRTYIAAISGKHCDNFLDYFHYLGKSEGYGLNHQELKNQLKSSPALVMFDGLDEIFDLAQREKITQEIIGFANDYPKAKILVTSRIIGFEGVALRHAEFSEYTLQDLSLTQIHDFAQGWYSLVFRDHPQEVTNRLQRIQQAVEHSPAIAQLAGNPLLLTIIAIIAKHQELPRDRVLLYEHAAKVLCHHWDVTAHKITDLRANFMSDTDKLDLLRRIAVKMQQAPSGLSGNVITAEELQQTIADYLIQRWKESPANAVQLSQGIIEQLRSRNFILCFYGADSYGFVHRTFLEYFCAAEIVQRFEKKQELSGDDLNLLFLEHYQEDIWHEILRLICGMIDAKFAGLLIDAILPEKIENTEHNAALTLAIQCLAEVSDLSEIPDTSRQVLACLCGWFEVEDYIDFEFDEFFEKNAMPAVERIGKNWVGREDFIDWVKLDNKNVYSHSGAFCFGRMVAAIWPDHIEIQKDLEALTQSQDILTVRMAFDALARCFKESTKRLLVQQLTADEAEKSANYSCTCIRTLAKHYQDQSETYPILTQCLQNEQEDVRSTVMRALVEHYRNRPETYPLLIQCLQDEHEIVRQASVWTLAKHYQDRTETYSLLTQRLQDKHAEVRHIVVWGLAVYCQGEAETYPQLKQCLQNEYADIRQSAVGALAAHYPNQPETYLLLKQCLQDNHENVRQSAVGALLGHYHDQAETYPLITPYLQDKHENVRQATVWALAIHCRDWPEVHSLLKLSLQDEHEDVRQTAVGALAEHYQNQAETYPLITQYLQDKHEAVRRSAIWALAGYYQDQPETYPLITQCLQDEHEDVRQAAVGALAENYQDRPEIYPLLTLSLQDKHEDVRQEAVGAFANNYQLVKRKLLSRDFDSQDPWLDPFEPITEDQIEQAAKKLNLSPEAIRQHYQEIAVEIPLQLEWLKL